MQEGSGQLCEYLSDRDTAKVGELPERNSGLTTIPDDSEGPSLGKHPGQVGSGNSAAAPLTGHHQSVSSKSRRFRVGMRDFNHAVVTHNDGNVPEA